MRTRALFWPVALLVIVGCAGNNGQQQSAHKLSERQRDSVIARSKLPGAGVMAKTIAVTDSAAARAKRLDAEMR
jgi:uncharacterized protein YcfL